MKHHHKHVPLSEALPDVSAQGARMIRKAVKIGCVVNFILMTLKLTAGYLGNSDALVADGFHSLNDVAADLIMLIFVGISYRAADDRYSYGYGKFETFSSFLISTFLIVVSVMIGAEGIESIVGYAHGETLPQPDIWTFVVVLFAMACKEGLYRFYSHLGHKADCHALIANAWHHRIDALASIATLIGVTFAHFFGPAYRILDPIASIVIAVFILIPALRLLVPAFVQLMERSLPFADREKARRIVGEVPGVKEIVYFRSRRNGHHLVFDIGIGIAPGSSIEEGYAITSEIESRLREAFCPHILVSVTTRPSRIAS